MKHILIILLLSVTVLAAPSIAQSEQELVGAFAEQGVHVDLEKAEIKIQTFLCQLREPLEYLLVLQPQGKDHESLLYIKDLNAEALNAAMLMVGADKGENGKMVPITPAPSDEEVQQGAATHVYKPPTGSGFILWAEWDLKQDDGRIEHYKYRVEDLVLNVQDERTYQRGEWVYLGSRFIRPHSDAKEFFAAQGEGNLISLVMFSPANHLLGGKDPRGSSQSIWYPNIFLLPPLDHPITLTFEITGRPRPQPL
jgi:hypothetical protein